VIRVFVEGVGLLGPGLCGWPASRPVLAGSEAYHSAPAIVPPGELLPPAERRRTPNSVKLALAVGHEALESSGRDAASVATAFATSSGDGDTLHQMCETLASAGREVSPTRFHNSVHNAAAGYWGIATHCREASTSLCGHDWSFAAGLLEAMVQVAVDDRPVALIAYDQPYPEPLHSVRPIVATFGLALVLAPQSSGRSFATLVAEYLPERAMATTMSDPDLEALRSGSPPARGLPLLAALARGASAPVVIDYLSSAHLRVTAAPC
jgi:hypothetical protein